MKTKDTTTSNLFIGIDIHKRSWKIDTATGFFDGFTLTIPANEYALQKYVDKHFKGYNTNSYIKLLYNMYR